MDYRNLTLEISDGIALLTINRPQVLNALSVETVGELGAAVAALAGDDTVKGVIVTGAGEKAFVAGADITELHPLDRAGAVAYAQRGQAVLNAIEQMGKPVIAAVNGFALGGGCELAMACHIRIAAENAKFGQPEVKLGAIPGYGGTQRLARLVGKGRALELCLSAAAIGAEEALRIGLVNRVVPREKLMEEARTMMAAILAMGPRAVALCIRAINDGLETTLAGGLAREAELFGEAAASSDWKEGTKAFMEKRPARFTGK